MQASPAAERRVLPGCRAGAHCAAQGFAAVFPLSACRTLLAVGTMAPRLLPGETDGARADMRSILGDRAMVDGHDAWGLLHHSNAALTMAGLGRLDALALISRGGADSPAVTGVGRPLPLVVTPDRLTVPVEGCVPIGTGWSVVLGTPDPAGDHLSPLLPPTDVALALALCDPVTGSSPVPHRTLLAVIVAD